MPFLKKASQNHRYILGSEELLRHYYLVARKEKNPESDGGGFSACFRRDGAFNVLLQQQLATHRIVRRKMLPRAVSIDLLLWISLRCCLSLIDFLVLNRAS